MTKRDFLRLHDLTLAEHATLFARAAELKAERRTRGVHAKPSLVGKTVALVFEKASTRTRVSFQAGVAQLGGQTIALSPAESQMGRGEPIEDTARVLSGYVDAIALRTFADERLATFAQAARVPVINALSDGGHPVQLLADLLTVIELLGPFGSLSERVAAFVGDGASNMARSWIEASKLFGFELRVAAPNGFRPPEGTWKDAPRVRFLHDPKEAVAGADVINTDVWCSMGQEDEAAARKAAFAGYIVDEALVRLADPRAIVLHCLPAHRGEEIAASVLEGKQSAVFEQAENRLHTTKALLELLLGG